MAGENSSFYSRNTEKTTHFARATPTCWQEATNQINPYEQARCAKETAIARAGHFYF